MIIIKETTIEDVLQVHKNVIEFDDLFPSKQYFEERYQNKETLIIVAYENEIPIGYIIGYDIGDQQFYCWMACVDIHYRRKGALSGLMEYQVQWAKSHGYHTLKIKTRNHRREMLYFLVKNEFYFTEVVSYPNIEDNRICLEKKI